MRDSGQPSGQPELVEGQKVLQMYGIELQGSQALHQPNAQSIATQRIAPRDLQVYDLDAIVSAARHQWTWRSIECSA